MREHLQESLSLVETDVKCLQDAAKHIEELASKLDSKDRVKWDLLPLSTVSARNCTRTCFVSFLPALLPSGFFR